MTEFGPRKRDDRYDYDPDDDQVWLDAGTIKRDMEREEIDGEIVVPKVDNLFAKRRTRAQAALAMRIRGASFDDIATVLEFATAASARAAVETILATQASDDGPAAWATQRSLHQLRLEGLLASVFSTAIDPTDDLHLAYNKRAMELMDRIAILQGYNAPQRSIIYTPEAAEFDAVVRHILETSEVTRPHEGDIFELEAPIPPEEGDFDE